MVCNNMQPAMSKFNQSLLLPPEMSNCNLDSVLSHRQMRTGHDADVDKLLAESGYDVKTTELPHLVQRIEHLESLCASQDAVVLSQLSGDAVHHNPSDLAAWLDCMIGEFTVPSSLVDGDIGSSEGAPGSIFVPQTPLHYALEDEYGDFNMGSCSTDQHSSSHGEFDTRPGYTNVKPKQSAPTSSGMHGSSESTLSISQLIRDAIANHGVAPAANGPRYDAKDYTGMVLLNDEMGDYQQFKIVEDQTSSNQVGSFYQGGIGDRSREGPFSSGYPGIQAGIPRSSSMPSLQPQQHATLTHGQQPHQQHRNQAQHMQLHVRQPQKFKPSLAPLACVSSQSSNIRAPYPNAPNQQQQHQLHGELSPQEKKVRANSISPSNSSPIIPHQEHHSSPHDKDSTYLHMQHMPDKLPHTQTHVQQGGAYVDVSEEGAQELGIRLVHLLMACAEAIPKNELAAALDMVREIKRLASSNSGAMGKVANHFVEALARRIYGANIEDWASLSQADAFSELLYSNFYEACPYLKFAHFTANQAILEAFKGQKFVHVIDFNLMQGSQWPALIQALALRPGGPPHLRMTGIGPPQPDNKDVLQEVGTTLAELAGSVNVEFSFRGVVATKLDDVKPWMFEVKPGEAIAVNSIFQLHRLLFGHVTSNPSMAPIDEVLTSIKSLSPKVVTVVEQEANHNSPVFLERFVEALHYYCTMFDSLEACSFPPQGREMACTEMYLAREIVNIVSCEGPARVERHEPLSHWRKRMLNVGFQPLHLGSNAFKQASLLLKLSSGEGYTVEENRGCLTLGWHSRPLIAASAWRCG